MQNKQRVTIPVILSMFVCAFAFNAWSALTWEEPIKSYDYENLMVQQQITEYTAWIVWLTGAQVMLAIVGTGAVVYSLYLSRKATNAAVSAVHGAQSMGERQLRAYLLLKTSLIRIDQLGYGLIDLIFENSGQTPAVDAVTYATVATFFRGHAHTGLGLSFDEPASKYSVPPGAERLKVTGENRLLTPLIVNAVNLGIYEVIVYGEINYYDVFGKPHRAWFQGYISGQNSFIAGKSLTLSPVGNAEDWNFERPPFNHSAAT